MQDNSVVTSLRRHWTLTLKGKGMFSLMYLIYSHVKDYELGFSCVGTCVLVNLSGFDSSRSFAVTRSLRYPETTLQADPA